MSRDMITSKVMTGFGYTVLGPLGVVQIAICPVLVHGDSNFSIPMDADVSELAISVIELDIEEQKHELDIDEKPAVFSWTPGP